MLRRLPRPYDPNLLAGRNPADDAAVYRLVDDLAIIQTVDFFAPVVDDAYDYGRIAAANSLSDVYAMGGHPVTAMNIVAFPMDSLDLDYLSEILRGGADAAAEAGVTVVGGHTVDDEEPKYGMAVTGTVRPDAFVRADGARPGDRLILTKPIGTGVISTALKAQAASGAHVANAVRWMTTLNRAASVAMLAARTHASSDVTGFGLLGHLHPMLHASGVAAAIHLSALPLLPGALWYAKKGLVPGGTRHNYEAVTEFLDWSVDWGDQWLELLSDPQTSGGLLLSIAPESVHAFRQAATRKMLAVEIGEVTEGVPGRIRILP